MALRRWISRLLLLLRYKFHLFLLVAMVFLLAVLHLFILPAASGGYNDKCYLSDEKRKTLRLLVQNISRTFDKFDVKYWLDYGTLLGACRMGDIIPWDHDADVSFIFNTDSAKVYEELAASGIQANALGAHYGSVSVDFMRWKPSNNSFSEVLLHKYYPEAVLNHEHPLIRYHHKLESFPLSWVVPAGRIDLQGVTVAVPNFPERFLARRYPLTYGIFGVQFPYKWKCWVPCWFSSTKGCENSSFHS